jgi:pantothenate kinase-related protein Tda10
VTPEYDGVCRSFARWILQQKRQRPPTTRLFFIGVNGAIGQGKTVFSQAVVRHLNLLLPPQEGQALTRSLDDYYLPKKERYAPEFLARGYNPGHGLSNRGPAGTHDTARLWEDLQQLESSSAGSAIDLPVFDKLADDRSPTPLRVTGKVGVFILEGWFVGTQTPVDVSKTDLGLRRAVAEALPSYQPIFDRLDALWVFTPPQSLEQIAALRGEQEETLKRETGKSGMSPEQIRDFVRYFYEQSWQEGVTSPTPPKELASFWAEMDSHHRFLKIAPAW